MGTPVHSNFSISEKSDDTPTRSQHGQTAPAILNGLKVAIAAAVKDTGEVIRQVSLEYFQTNLLPPLRKEIKLDAVIKSLKASKAITNDRWTVFPVDPCKSAAKENPTFLPFEELATHVATAAKGMLPSKVQELEHVIFRCNPDSTPTSSLRNNTSRPDCYGLYTKHPRYKVLRPGSKPHVHWETIAVTGENKLDETPDDITDNNHKIIWSLSHMMREDVRRRFAFGYTIENCNMRLWFASRADLLVSQPFNFITEHKTLAHFFLSFMFASESQLGYDTTMVPVKTPSGYDYKIDVRGSDGVVQTYRTEKLINNIGAESIRGRGTRVWKAKLLVRGRPKGESVALKDTWIDDDRQREGDIVRLIKDDANVEQKAKLDKYFLTILHHGDVFIGEEHNQTLTLLRRNVEAPTDLPLYPLTVPSVKRAAEAADIQSKLPVTSGTIRRDPEKPPLLLNFGIKAHYRVVFKEVGKSIDKLTSVAKICEALCETLIALNTMHQCGWIHRDISPGNILQCAGGIKIMDLEYAKNMKIHTEAHSLRTGTEYYMAIEADTHRYQFLPRLEDSRPGVGMSALESAYSAWKPPVQSATPASSTKDKGKAKAMNKEQDARGQLPIANAESSPLFKQNPLHDVESVWWLATGLTLDRVVDDSPDHKDNPQFLVYYTKHEAFYHSMFSNKVFRIQAFASNGAFSRGIKVTHPALLPAAKALETARAELVDQYREVERDVEDINHESGSAAIGQLMQSLFTMAQHYAQNDVQLQKIRGLERKRDPEPPGPVDPGVSLDAQQPVAPPSKEETASWR